MACAGYLSYQFGLPVGSTVLVVASEPGGSWGCGLSERHEGVYSGAPGMFPVLAHSSIWGGNGQLIN